MMKKLLLLLIPLLLPACSLIEIRSLVTPTVTDIPATGTATRTPVPTETRIWFPPTATPRPLHTPTPYPTVVELPELGDLLFEDTFADDSNWQTFRSPAGNAVISENQFTLGLQESDGTVVSYGTFPMYGDYYLSLDVNLNICSYYRDGYGILFRIKDSDNYYRWLFNCQAESRIDRFYKGRRYTLADWAANGKIRRAAPQRFTVGIEAEGSSLVFFVNDSEVARVEDTLFESGGFGLTAFSEGLTPVSVSFRDFRLYEIDTEEK